MADNLTKRGRQQSDTDCGATALFIVLNELGHRPDPAILNALALKGGDTSLLDIKQAAACLGVNAVGMHSGYEELANLRAPFIAHIRASRHRGHFVVVLEWHPAGVDIVDPAYGCRDFKKRSGFVKHWSGYLMSVALPTTAPSGGKSFMLKTGELP